MSDTNTAITNFIIESLKFRGEPGELTPTYPLIDREAIDSMGIFQLVGFIEDEYGIEIGDDDLVVENFATVEAITSLVEKKRGS